MYLFYSNIFTDPHLYRFTCWKLKDRGAVGESILHLCLLNATSLHADIAKRLLRFYPKLINDIYISDEYYGKLLGVLKLLKGLFRLFCAPHHLTLLYGLNLSSI